MLLSSRMSHEVRLYQLPAVGFNRRRRRGIGAGGKYPHRYLNYLR
jgi:hypothetical protein